MLAKYVKPSSLITPLHVGEEAALATWPFTARALSLGSVKVTFCVLNTRSKCANS